MLRLSVLGLLWSASPVAAAAVGELVPASPNTPPLHMTDHELDVVLNNGFARATVTQTFHNPGTTDLEATYRFPLPEHASLSEMAVTTRDGIIRGEVVGADRAQRLYDDAKARGEDAALASKDGYTGFTFQVASVPAGEDVVVRFVYYQPLEIDAGVGRWVYPLEPGGNDEGTSFWSRVAPAGDLDVSVVVKSAWPLADVRTPGWASTIDAVDEGHYRVSGSLSEDAMDRDLVVYYRLADDLPGRIEVVPYKPGPDAPGTYMLIVTPGADLEPTTAGADYVFLLDVSGSMAHTIRTATRAVARSLPELRPEDRFRVVTFSTDNQEVVPWTPATPENVAAAVRTIEGIQTSGGTNLYAGLTRALEDLDADRATSLVLVTDAVANDGELRSTEFHRLLAEHDIRMFSFMMGNSGNWPLMNVITDATGGYATGVSNEDDIVGHVMRARSKMGHEALHDAHLSVTGTEVWGTTDANLGKVFRGEQLVAFGRYDEPGPVRVALDARITGEPHTFATVVDLPQIAPLDPELERLWALARVEEHELARDRGAQSGDEAAGAIRKLGVDYQIVTDETSMVALTEAAFSEAGVERRNRERVAIEHAAQDAKAGQPARNHRVDTRQPAFPAKAPRLGGGGGGGGGAIDPFTGFLALGLGGLALWRKRSDR